MTENYCKDCIHLKSRQLHLSDYIDYYCDKLLFSIYPPRVNEHTEKDNCFEAVKH